MVTRKRIHDSFQCRIENSVPRDLHLTSLGKPRDANQRSFGQNLLSHLTHVMDSYTLVVSMHFQPELKSCISLSAFLS